MNNNISKIYHRFSLVKKYVFKKAYCKKGPLVIEIEVTNRCNLNCIMCPRQTMRRTLGDMNFCLFKKIIDNEKNNLEFVWLQGYGEPLLNKEIFRMIEYCKKSGVRTGISTNATILDKETTINLLSAGLDYIIFAFDGVSKKTFEKIRKGSKYEIVITNIRNFLKEKLRMKAKNFSVIQCIYMQETEKEIEKFKAIWNIAGIDAIRIRQVTYGVGNNKCIGGKRFKNPKSKWPCYWLWHDPLIEWDGTMVPCCQDVNGMFPLGNVKEESLANLWNSDKMLTLRKIHISGKSDEISMCKDCNMYQPNLGLIIGSFCFHAFTLNKMLPIVETLITKLRFKGK